MATNNYINNKKMFVVMRDYIIECRSIREEAESIGEDPYYPQIPNYIGECFLLIANNLASKGNFYGYPFKEEMIMDGVENCVRYARNFDPDKSENPFAYFTQVIYYAFIRRINSEKDILYIKHKNLQDLQLIDMLDGYTSFSVEFNEISNEFIRDYENRRLTKRKKSGKVPSNNVVQHFEGHEDKT